MHTRWSFKGFGYHISKNNMLESIRLKLHDAVGPHQLIRHVNGNTTDNRATNLQYCSFQDVLENPDWKVDHVCHLDEQEIAFVENLRLIQQHFQAPP